MADAVIKQSASLPHIAVEHEYGTDWLTNLIKTLKTGQAQELVADIVGKQQYTTLLTQAVNTGNNEEALLILSNAIALETDAKRNNFMLMEKIMALMYGLTFQNEELLLTVLRAVQNILNIASSQKESLTYHNVSSIVAMIEQSGGLELMEALQTHPSQAVYEAAVLFLEGYAVEAEMEDV